MSSCVSRSGTCHRLITRVCAPHDAHRPAQPVHALPDGNLAATGVAGRQHDELGAGQVHGGEVGRGQQPVFRRIGQVAAAQPGVGTGEREPGVEQGSGEGAERTPVVLARAAFRRLVVEEVAVRGDVENDGRALLLERSLDSISAEPRLDTEQVGDVPSLVACSR